MLYIIDNQEEYSDHTLYFIESELPLAGVEAAMGSYLVIGVTEKIEWLDPGTKQGELFIRWDVELEQVLARIKPWRTHPEIVRALRDREASLLRTLQNRTLQQYYNEQKKARLRAELETLQAFMQGSS